MKPHEGASSSRINERDALRAEVAHLREREAEARRLLRLCADYVSHLSDCPERDEVTDVCACGFRQLDERLDAFLAAAPPSLPTTNQPTQVCQWGLSCTERGCPMPCGRDSKADWHPMDRCLCVYHARRDPDAAPPSPVSAGETLPVVQVQPVGEKPRETVSPTLGAGQYCGRGRCSCCSIDQPLYKRDDDAVCRNCALGQCHHAAAPPVEELLPPTFHRCTGCEWFIDTTCMSERQVIDAVHGHLRAEHSPAPPVVASSPGGGARDRLDPDLARDVATLKAQLHEGFDWYALAPSFADALVRAAESGPADLEARVRRQTLEEAAKVCREQEAAANMGYAGTGTSMAALLALLFERLAASPAVQREPKDGGV